VLPSFSAGWSLKVFYFQARHWSPNKRPGSRHLARAFWKPVPCSEIIRPGAAFAGLLLSLLTASAQFADGVLRYQSGALPASIAGFTNATAALFEPSRVTPGMFGGPVDPFSPPYLSSQVVSVGMAARSSCN
jgi:hypothetical protein